MNLNLNDLAEIVLSGTNHMFKDTHEVEYMIEYLSKYYDNSDIENIVKDIKAFPTQNCLELLVQYGYRDYFADLVKQPENIKTKTTEYHYLDNNMYKITRVWSNFFFPSIGRSMRSTTYETTEILQESLPNLVKNSNNANNALKL